jgi:hypothetical protein
MSTQSTLEQTRRWLFPFGFLAGPVLWGLQLLAGYGLASLSCAIGNKLPIYLLIAVSALIVLSAAILTLQAWRTMADDSFLSGTDQTRESRMFWTISSFVLSMLFFILILVTGITAVFLSPCPIITMPLP